MLTRPYSRPRHPRDPHLQPYPDPYPYLNLTINLNVYQISNLTPSLTLNVAMARDQIPKTSVIYAPAPAICHYLRHESLELWR